VPFGSGTGCTWGAAAAAADRVRILSEAMGVHAGSRGGVLVVCSCLCVSGGSCSTAVCPELLMLDVQYLLYVGRYST
jgi:hypothetical protein